MVHPWVADPIMGFREGRIAENEAAFRAINERMSEWPEHQQAAGAEPIPFVCECDDPHCFERVHLTRPQYEAVRADSSRFALTPGHELPDLERVVERHPGYLSWRRTRTSATSRRRWTPAGTRQPNREGETGAWPRACHCSCALRGLQAVELPGRT